MGPEGAKWKKFFTAAGKPFWDKPGHNVSQWEEPEDWDEERDFNYPWKQYITENGDFFFAHETTS